MPSALFRAYAYSVGALLAASILALAMPYPATGDLKPALVADLVLETFHTTRLPKLVGFTAENAIVEIQRGEKFGTEKVAASDLKDGKEIWSFVRAEVLSGANAVSPDGAFLVSSGYPKEGKSSFNAIGLQVWRTKDGAKLEVGSTQKGVRRIIFGSNTHDFVSIASLSIQYWNVDANGKCQAGNLISNEDGTSFNGLLFSKGTLSPDLKRSALRSEKTGELLVWDLTTKKQVCAMKGIESLIYQVSYSPCGKWIVTIEDKMPIRIWDANKGAELKKLDMKGDATTPIAISPDSKWLAIGGGALTRGEAAIYEMPTGKRLLSLAVEKGATKFQLLKIRALSFNQKGDLLAASSQGTLSVWKIKELAEPAKEVPPKPQIDNKPKAPKKAESPRAETGGPAHNKEVPTRLSAREVFVNRKLQDDIAYVGFRAENSIVVTAAGYFSPYKREISAWDLNDGKERWAVREPAEGRKNIDAKMKYALSPDGMVIVESGKQWLNVINAENGSTISKSSRDIDDINSVLKAPFKSSIPQIVFAPDSRSFARMGSGTLEIRKAPQFSFATAVFRENKFGVKDMPRWSELEHGDLSRDLTRVAAPRPGKQILVWDIAEKKEICKMVDLKDPVQRISYSPCGKWIVSASSALGNRNVFLWDANTGALMKEIEFASRVWDFTFSPDGKWLACGTGQVKAGEVTVWEMPGAKKLVSIEIGGAATALAFNRQGNMLAGGCRGACHIWALKEMKLK